jgi:hypothetical protein
VEVLVEGVDEEEEVADGGYLHAATKEEQVMEEVHVQVVHFEWIPDAMEGEQHIVSLDLQMGGVQV